MTHAAHSYVSAFADLDVTDDEIADACRLVLNMREDGASYDAIREQLEADGWDQRDALALVQTPYQILDELGVLR